MQEHTPTMNNYDEEVEQFHGDIELAMQRVHTMPNIVMGDLNAKVGTKQSGEQGIRYYRIRNRDNLGDMLVQFAERNRIQIMNTFFKKHKNRK